MSRQFFVGGNWKLNPASLRERNELIMLLNNAELDPAVEVVIAPPSLYVLSVAEHLRRDIKVSAQNCFIKPSGAFTGELSPAQLADAQIPYVILGHSERRSIFGESSELVAQKTRAALDHGLSVILCIGETLAEREANLTAEVCRKQLEPVAALLTPQDWRRIVIAYEPVWAIGTGKVATAAQAQEAHADIRMFLGRGIAPEVGESTRILYGGSVTAANCRELAVQPDVDGFLVGGASLKPEFVNIINAHRL